MKLLNWIKNKILGNKKDEIDILVKEIFKKNDEIEDLKEKNRKCQESINKTNSYWLGKTGGKKKTKTKS